MSARAILYPLCAQVFLTFLVWIWMYYERLTEIKRNKINPQDLADGDRAAVLLKRAVNTSDNFENLFEAPVLFYVAVLVLYGHGLSNLFYIIMAWVFVTLRYAHSFIHCTYNTVTHRFTAYALSTIALWIIWFRIGLQIIFGV